MSKSGTRAKFDKTQLRCKDCMWAVQSVNHILCVNSARRGGNRGHDTLFRPNHVICKTGFKKREDT